MFQIAHTMDIICVTGVLLRTGPHMTYLKSLAVISLVMENYFKGSGKRVILEFHLEGRLEGLMKVDLGFVAVI